MSRNASGTYTAPTNSWNTAVEGTDIDEADWEETLADIESALTDSLDRTGKGKITAHIDFDENASPGTPAANVGRLYVADVGGVTTLKFKDASSNDYNLLLTSPGLAYTFSTSTTTTSDPGSGIIRLNNATLASVTEIAIDDADANGANISAYVLTWDDASGSNRGTLIIQSRTSPGNVVIFTISGASTDESGWTRLAVTYVTSAGSLVDAAPLGVTFIAAGPTGATGSTGAAGASGTDAGIRWLFDSSTTMADPGAGDLRLNNATLSSVTAAAISDSCAESGNPSVETFVLSWDDSTTTALRGTLVIKKSSAPANFAVYSVTGSSTDNSGWTELALTHVQSNGSFSAADTLSVSFYRTGNAGAGTGDVVGPASATDNAVVRFDGTTGKLVQNSAVTIADTTGLIAGSRFANTGLKLEDTNASHLLTVAPGSDLTADRTLTVTTGDADRTLTVSGNATVSQDYSTSGSPQFTGIELSHATANTLTGSSGDLLVEGTIVKKVGKETIFVPAGAMTARTTNGAASGTTELATNDVMLRTFDFDTTTEEGVGFFVAMPKSWNESTVTFKPFWTAASGSGGVVFGLAAYSFSDDDALDTAVSGQQTSTDTLITANDMHIGPESSAITIGGTPAEGDVVYFEITREVANGSDTLGVDAKLIGIHLYFTTNASTDA